MTTAVLIVRSAVGTWLVLLGGLVIDGRRGYRMVSEAISRQIDREQEEAVFEARFGRGYR